MNVKDIPLPVKRALRKLGQDLSDARKRRRIPMELASEKAGMSRATLGKIEKGESGVAIGAYARALFSMGMLHRLAELADPAFDKMGLGLERENLPKRIRSS